LYGSWRLKERKEWRRAMVVCNERRWPREKQVDGRGDYEPETGAFSMLVTRMAEEIDHKA
jgi:hypothetical protein